MLTKNIRYRDFGISAHDFMGMQYVHKDYDGPEDSRAGIEETEEGCRTQIDEYWTDKFFDAIKKINAASRAISDAAMDLAIFGSPRHEMSVRIASAGGDIAMGLKAISIIPTKPVDA